MAFEMLELHVTFLTRILKFLKENARIFEILALQIQPKQTGLKAYLTQLIRAVAS